MAYEPIYDVASLESKNKLCSAQTVVETRLLPMGGVSIFKVLSYNAESFVTVTDVFTGEARVSGRVTFKVLFLDTAGGMRAIETNTDFTDKITCEDITTGRPEVLHRILDIDILSVAEGEIRLAAIVEMDLFDNASTRIKFLSGSGDNIYTHEQQLSFQKLAASVHDSFSLGDELALDAQKLLSVESALIVTGCAAGIGNINVEGQIITNIIAENEGEVSHVRTVTPFSNMFEASGARGDCHVEASARLLPVRAEFAQADGQSAVLLEFSVDVTAFAYYTDTVTAISDAFSITNEISAEYEDLHITKNREQKLVYERVEGNVSLSESMPIADKILASAGSKLSVANSYIENGHLILEGTVTSSIIYFSEETGTKNSVDVELPFSITSDKCEGETVTAAFGEVLELTAKIRRGNEIDIKSEIAVTVYSVDYVPFRIVSELSIGDEIEIPSAAMSLHITRGGETLWDVAKALRTTPEVILLQNSEIELPLKGGERVIVYRHLKNK